MLNLNVGDSVRLKSGGPKLVVTGVHTVSMSVEVMWIDGDELKAALFLQSSLELAENGEPQ